MERIVVRLWGGCCQSPRSASGQASCVNSGAGQQPSIGVRFAPLVDNGANRDWLFAAPIEKAKAALQAAGSLTMPHLAFVQRQ
jgi:hypothetical protein